MFSIIVPVYNVEKYIERCLLSIYRQSFSFYEVIIVDDGTMDRSAEIIDNFLRKYNDSRFKLYHKDNGGLSSARNFGVELAKNEYLLFIDADDYIDENLLEELYEVVRNSKSLDVLRFPKRILTESKEQMEMDSIQEFYEVDGEAAFERLRNNRITLETAWTYCINRKYWLDNKFQFPKGRLHEDLGIIPRAILQASSVSAVSTHSVYNYCVRAGSITTTTSRTSQIKKLEDVYYYYCEEKEFLGKNIYKNHSIKRMYEQYYADAVLIKLCGLSRKDKVLYKKKFNYKNILREYPVDSVKDKMKKIYYRIKLL